MCRNEGDGGYRDVTTQAAAGDTAWSAGSTFLDYDNDGDGDLLVLRGAWGGRGGRHPNSRLRNDGTGRSTARSFARSEDRRVGKERSSRGSPQP